MCGHGKMTGHTSALSAWERERVKVRAVIGGAAAILARMNSTKSSLIFGVTGNLNSLIRSSSRKWSPHTSSATSLAATESARPKGKNLHLGQQCLPLGCLHAVTRRNHNAAMHARTQVYAHTCCCLPCFQLTAPKMPNKRKICRRHVPALAVMPDLLGEAWVRVCVRWIMCVM